MELESRVSCGFAVDVLYGNNAGICIEHILFSRKKIGQNSAPETVKTKSQIQQNLLMTRVRLMSLGLFV